MGAQLALIETPEPLAPVEPMGENPAAVYLAGLAPTGRRTMRGKLDRAAAILGFANAFAAPWAQLRFMHLVAVRTRLLDEGLAPTTVNATVYAIKGVARAAFNLGLMDGDELQRIRSVKPVPGTRLPSGRGLTAGEIGALMNACADDGGPGGVRDAALIGLLYAGGLRRAEIVGLDLADLNQETGELVVRGKGNRERTLWVRGGAADALADWLEWRGDEPGALFCPVDKGGTVHLRRMTAQALYNMLRKRARQAGVKEFSPHDLRRSFVSDLLDAGADVVTVQKLAGHASVTTTARYDRRGEQAKRKAVGLLHVPYQRRTLPLAEG